MSEGFDNGSSQGPPPSPGLGVGSIPPPPPIAPPTPSRPDAGWGPGRAFAALGALIGILLIETLVIALFDPGIESLGARLALQAMLGATLVAVAFGAVGPGFLVPAAALGLRRPLRPAVGATVIAYLVYVACALLIAVLLQPEQEDVTRELGSDQGTLGSIAAGFLIIAVAPLTEEIFFRGFMFAGLRRALPFAFAALISASIWGLFHYTGPDSWGVVVQLTVFGIVLCWLYERTGSIWPTIAVHAFNNALAFTLLTSS
jgi:membrane protease YdiL (CAAX protease family)